VDHHGYGQGRRPHSPWILVVVIVLLLGFRWKVAEAHGGWQITVVAPLLEAHREEPIQLLSSGGAANPALAGHVCSAGGVARPSLGRMSWWRWLPPAAGGDVRCGTGSGL
jgi:hypothetical protein